MRTTGKQPIKPIKPTPASPAIMLIEPDAPAGDQERDEEDVSDKLNYQTGTKAFREVAAEESKALDAAPEDAGEVREREQPDIKDGKLTLNSHAKTKKTRPSKEK